MSSPIQPDVLDRMIARLEEANARSYNGPSRVDEPPSTSDHGDRRKSPSQPPASKRVSWIRQGLVVVMLLVIAASVYAATFASELSYAKTVKLSIARWALQTGSQATPQGDVAPAPQMSREVEPRLREMTGELASLRQQIEQLRASQDLVSRSDAEAAAQYKIDREQMMRDNANVADQLRVTQEQLKAAQAQLAAIVSSEATNSSRRLFRRKRISALAQRVRARSSTR